MYCANRYNMNFKVIKHLNKFPVSIIDVQTLYEQLPVGRSVDQSVMPIWPATPSHMQPIQTCQHLLRASLR